MYFALFLVFLCFLCAVAGALWMVRGAFGRWRWRRRYEKATVVLQRNASRMEQEFLAAAAATGKHRGILWNQARFHNSALLVRDRATGDIYALVGISIAPPTSASNAVVRGGMEDVHSASNVRCVTGMLEWKSQRWTTAGRVLLNLEPPAAVVRYADSLDLICQVVFVDT